jgi:hypothetical protein
MSYIKFCTALARSCSLMRSQLLPLNQYQQPHIPPSPIFYPKLAPDINIQHQRLAILKHNLDEAQHLNGRETISPHDISVSPSNNTAVKAECGSDVVTPRASRPPGTRPCAVSPGFHFAKTLTRSLWVPFQRVVRNPCLGRRAGFRILEV